MPENIVFLQCEDDFVTFEKDDGTTITYPIGCVPFGYKDGDIITVIIHDKFIEFLELNIDEMNRRYANMAEKKSRLRNRAKRSTNQA